MAGLFEDAGFSLTPPPAAAPTGGAGSLFKDAGFVLPDGKKAAAAPQELADNIPTPERYAAATAAQDARNAAKPKKSDLQEFRETIDPWEAAKTVGINWYHDMIEHGAAGLSAMKQGATEVSKGDRLPSFPSVDPTTWSPGGMVRAGAGAAATLFSPATGGINALVTRPVSAVLGPEAGERAGDVANLLLPTKFGGKTIQKVAPSSRGVNALVEAIGPENVPEVVAGMRANPRMTPADLSAPVRLTTQGLMAGGSPEVQDFIAKSVKTRNASRLEAANTAFTEAMGPSPDVPAMVEGLKDRARKAGQEAIQPALKNASAVDVSPVIAAIDKEVKPGIEGLKSGLPLSLRQEELWRLRNQLVDPETGETLVDAQRLHEIQSRTGDKAYNLQKSADGWTRDVGNGLRDVNEKLVDAIDTASKTANPVPAKFRDVQLETPSGKTDATGVWFLKGDKPTYAQATEQGARATLGPLADDLAKYPSLTGKNANGNPITVWYKPGEEARAQKAVDIFSKGAPADEKGQVAYHLANGEAMGYPRSATESYVRQRFGAAADDVLGADGPGPYRQGRAKFKDAKDVSEAFESGFDTLKNRSGIEGALADSPAAFKKWIDDATPEEVVARRLGTRADIDRRINGVKNGALAGQTITQIPYNREKLVMLFGEKEAERLVRVMDDATREAQTSAAIVAGSKTAETAAARDRIETHKVGGGNPLSYVAPVAAEVLGQSAGLPFLGLAGSLAAKGLQMGGQKLLQISDVARNREFARNALAAGPFREETINSLLAHPKVVRELQKRNNALVAP